MSTYGAMLDRVQDATQRWGDGNRTQIKLELNEAIKQVDALLRPSITGQTKTLTANKVDYLIATELLLTNVQSIREIVYTPTTSGAQTRVLQEVTPDYIRQLRGYNNTVASSWSDYYALEGLDLLMLYPTTSQTGDTIVIWYQPRPADLVNDSDVPVGLPAEWHELYELSCIQRSMRGLANHNEVQRYVGLYDKKLGDYRKWRIRHVGSRSRVVIPGPVRPRLPHDPSTDMGAW